MPTIRFTFNIDIKLHEMLGQHAESEYNSMSGIINVALSEYFKRKENADSNCKKKEE